MVEQARSIAAALGGHESLASSDAEALLTRLEAQGDSRIRVFDHNARLLVDSRRFAIPSSAAEAYSAGTSTGRDRLLYRLGASIMSIRRTLGEWFQYRLIDPLDEADNTSEVAVAPETAAALAGRYGAATRATHGQRSMTMNSAVPIRHGSRVVGAVVVSQSTYRVLQALYSIRLRIFEVVVASIVLAALLSALMSATIVRPLLRLRNAASSLADRRTPLSGTFKVVDRRDEIGDLARALEELALRLDAQIRHAESFAADVSHEFRNPLASIRTAAEMLVAADDAADRERFFAMLTKDVDRLERLVSGVRELARIDAQVAHEAPTLVDVGALLEEVVQDMTSRGARATLTVRDGNGCVARGSRERLYQVFENILENARSFAPDGPIDITLSLTNQSCQVWIADSGPGIPQAHLDLVFDRFFTYRPGGPTTRREHAGLGLAIARTIVEGYGGRITAANRPGRGACFLVELPASADSGGSGARESNSRFNSAPPCRRVEDP